ncbi:MAG: hypothetical protein ABI406_02610, partial [Ktedonobacteraceae bacterium]
MTHRHCITMQQFDDVNIDTRRGRLIGNLSQSRYIGSGHDQSVPMVTGRKYMQIALYPDTDTLSRD